MSHRPLVLVSGLTVGDYLLWNWSLNGGHGVLALVSGLTLPPLAVALLWLLVLSAARLLALSTRRSTLRADARDARQRGQRGEHSERGASGVADGLPSEEPATTATPAGTSSRKLAA